MPVLKTLGSLRFAILLIVGLAVILSISTVMESIHGTPFAQKHFYNTRWFDVLLSLLWVNIFCSTWTRWPFQKKHVGFVITHLGILIFLLGALLSRSFGVEGRMSLFENEEKNRLFQEGSLLNLTVKGEKLVLVNLESAKKKLSLEVPLKLNGAKVFIHKILDQGQAVQVLSEGTTSDPENHAVQATLSGETMGVHETFVLAEHDPENPHAFFTDIGPAHFELKTEKPENLTGAKIVIERKSDRETWNIALGENPRGELPLGNSGLLVANVHYYPNAKIQENRIANAPDQIHFNPAVEFEVRDAQGRVERHTRFYLFPTFDSLRGGRAANLFDLDVKLISPPLPDEIQSAASPSFIFSARGARLPDGQGSTSGGKAASDEHWSYEIHSKRNAPVIADLELNKKISTGWMDMTVEVHKIFNHAKITKEVRPAKKGSAGERAVQVAVRKKDGSEENRWILENGGGVDLPTGEGSVHVILSEPSRALPFRLRLLDFRKTDYPGTTSPSSFESDVILSDPTKRITLEKTIKMNQPLDYHGYRIFQSSYMQDADMGEGSVFTITKNPGILLIYGSAPVILLGVILLFYLHPFFNDRIEPEAPSKGIMS